MDKLKQIPQKLLEIWKKYDRKQKSIIISVAAIVVIALIILVVVIQKPSYETLTQCASYSELQEVTTLMNTNGYDYQVDDTNMIVRVNKKNLTDAKMALATADIKADGYTLDDALNSSFNTTETDKQKRYQLYLENKFANDLSAIDGVKSASVTVVLPENNSVYSSTKTDASVSVVLNLTKTMAEDTAANLAQFLATNVGNTSTNKITIINTSGELLFSGSDSLSAGAGSSSVGINSQLKYKNLLESSMKTSIKQDIVSTKMFDDVAITMNLNMNWDQVNEIITEYYPPDGMEQGMLLESYEEASTGGTGSGGVPGTSSNDEDTTYYVTDGTGSTSEYTLKKYQYSPNVIVTTTNKNPGQVMYADSTMSVVLTKNVMYNEEECEALGYLDNTTWEEYKAANSNPVQIDVNDQWIALLSNGTGIGTRNIAVMAYQVPYFIDAESTPVTQTVTFWLEIALAVVILGLLGFVLFRSARPLTIEETEPELSVEEMLATTKENQPSVDDIDLQEKSETRKAIEKFVDENPEAVALLLRNWLNDDWE